ncbi:MAG: hypothetical protein ACXVIB_02390, partial [Halobacteriota archaeon]
FVQASTRHNAKGPRKGHKNVFRQNSVGLVDNQPCFSPTLSAQPFFLQPLSFFGIALLKRSRAADA